MTVPRSLGYRLAVLAFVGAAVAAVGAASPAAAAPARGTILYAGGPTAVANSYIVVLQDSMVTPATVDSVARRLASRGGGRVAHAWKDALRGFEVSMSATAAMRLAADPAVKYVEQNHTVSLDATQSPTPSWGLDRIDQHNLPLNNSYTYPTTASNVKIYGIDTGIRITHVDFGGRAVWGTNTVDTNNTDCHGHGTHTAGTFGGSTYGVAKGAQLVAVKVLNCAGSGTNAQVIAGINWVTADHQAGQLAVANMSLGGSFDQATNDAVTNSIADGVTYAIAAGNSNANACSFSPASAPNAVTVGATDINDARASFSNFGTCLDIFGPGVNITSDWSTSDTATNTISGTSMATPHAAGVAALILSQHPTFTPQQVRDQMVADATSGVVTNPGTGSPNKLLFVTNGTPPPPPTTVYSDTFETATGWTTNSSGTDTATTGQWERGDPEATSSGVALQLGTTVSGTNDLVTARLAGASAGVNDVDSGLTSVRSPAISLPGTGTLTLSYSWYLAHLNNATSADFFRVSIVHGGVTTVVFTQAGSAVNRAGAWATGSVTITAYAGQSVNILFEAADNSTASLIEAGVDNVLITQQT